MGEGEGARAGAPADDAQLTKAAMAQAVAEGTTAGMPGLAHATERNARAAEGERKARGTRGGIHREDELDLYIARGCNTLSVEACEGITGKEFFDSLKRMCANSKSTMRDIRWPALVTNRIAYAFATLSFGSGPHDLSVADCIPARNEDFDNYRLPDDDKLEPHQRAVTHMQTWFKRARCEIQKLESVMGTEHGAQRREALDHLEELHENDPDEFPDD